MSDSQEPENVDPRALEFKRLYEDERLTMQEIGDRHGISRQRVQQILSSVTLSLHYGMPRKEERDQRLREAWERIGAGEATVAQEAKRLGYSRTKNLQQAFYRLGLKRGPKEPPPHGTLSRYTYHRCRCELCRAAARDSRQERVGQKPPRHGTPSSYRNWGCRCVKCRKAERDDQRKRRIAKRPAKETVSPSA